MIFRGADAIVEKKVQTLDSATFPLHKYVIKLDLLDFPIALCFTNSTLLNIVRSPPILLILLLS